MKKLLCILILFVAINVCASESSSMDTHSHTTRLKSGAIKRKTILEETSDDSKLLDHEKYQEINSEPQQKKFKPMPSTPPLTATTNTQDPSKMDLLKECLANLSSKTEQSSMMESQAIVTMAIDITAKLTQRVEILEKHHEEDKIQQAALLESFNQIIKFIVIPSKTSHDSSSQPSCIDSVFKHEDSAAMVLDFGLEEINLDQ